MIPKVYDQITKTWYKAYPRADVEAVDMLLRIAGKRETVTSSSDWRVLEEIIKFYFARFPQESKEFLESVKTIRQTRRNKKALSVTKESKYLAAMPYRLMALIRKLFPFQQFDKRFMYRFIRRVSVLRVGEVSD